MQKSTGIVSRKLLVVRHAKSSWPLATLHDFDRPLNERGMKDAPGMAQRIFRQKKIDIDLFISSPAKRALATACFFADQFGKAPEAIIQTPSLYHAPVPVFYTTIEQIEDKYKTVAMFSHNPGITEFVNTLCPQVRIANMPTCGIFAIEFPGKWKDFETVEKNFLFFDFPKNM